MDGFVPHAGTVGVPVQFTGSMSISSPHVRPVTFLWEVTNDSSTNNSLWDPGEAVVYDNVTLNRKYDSGEAVIAGTTPQNSTFLKDDAKIRFYDANTNSLWNVDETVVYDANGNGLYDSGEPVIAGANPPLGTVLSDDPNIKYVDADVSCTIIAATSTSCEAVWTFPTPGDYLVYSIPLDSAGLVGGSASAHVFVTRPPPVSLIPSDNRPVFPGQVFAVEVVVGNSTNPVNDLDGWEATLTYDPTMVTALGVGPNSVPCDPCTAADYGADPTFSGYVFFKPPTINNTIGRLVVGATFFTFPAVGPSGSGRLVQIGFSLDSSGSSTIHFADVKLRSIASRQIDRIPAGNLNDSSVTSAGTLDFSPTTADAGTPQTFSAAATGGVEPYSFTWGFGDGTSTVTGSVVVHSYSLEGTFLVTLSVSDNAGNSGSIKKNVIVDPALTADFSFTTPTNEGQSITFTATASGGTAPYSLSWSFGDGGTSTANPTSHTYNTVGSKIVSLTVTDANSVSKTISHTVTVSQLPLSVDFSFDPSSPNMGQSVTFTSVVAGGTTPYSFTWNFGDGSSGTGSSASHSYSTQGSFNATLTVTDTNGISKSIFHTVSVTGPGTVPGLDYTPYILAAVGAAVVLLAIFAYLRRRRPREKTAQN